MSDRAEPLGWKERGAVCVTVPPRASLPNRLATASAELRGTSTGCVRKARPAMATGASQSSRHLARVGTADVAAGAISRMLDHSFIPGYPAISQRVRSKFSLQSQAKTSVDFFGRKESKSVNAGIIRNLVFLVKITACINQ